MTIYLTGGFGKIKVGERENIYVPEHALKKLAKEVILRALKDLVCVDIYEPKSFAWKMAVSDSAWVFFQNAENGNGEDIWFKILGINPKNVLWKAIQVAEDGDASMDYDPIAYKCCVCGKKVPKWMANGSLFEDEKVCYLCWLRLQKFGRKPLTNEQRKAVIEKWKRNGKRCYYCGKQIGYREITIDHIIPVSNGGTNVIENLVPCCKSCNSSKRDEDIRYWLPQRILKIKDASVFEAIRAKKLADRLYRFGDRRK